MNPSIQLDIDVDRFAANVKNAVETFEFRTLQTAISNIVADHYSSVLDSAVESKQIRLFRVSGGSPTEGRLVWACDRWGLGGVDEIGDIVVGCRKTPSPNTTAG
jgi:hypothetical protein